MNFADNLVAKATADPKISNIEQMLWERVPTDASSAFDGTGEIVPARRYAARSVRSFSLIGLQALQQFADAIPTELVILDASGHILIENSRWRRMGAHHSRPGVGDDCAALGRFVGDDQSGPRFAAKLRRVLSGEQHRATRKFTVSCKRKTRHYLLHARQMPYPNDHLVLIVNNDISELQKLRQQRRLLAERLARSEELERRRIAREMHDSTVQDLVAIGLNLRRLAHLAGDDIVDEVCSDIREILKRTQEDIRTMSYLLHPPMLDEGGLISGLRALIRGLSQRMDIRIHLETDLGPERFPVEAEMALYRVVQEALINIHLHAHATQAIVRCTRSANRLTINVEDDGIGFGSDDSNTIQPGVGISGMRSRLSQLHGKLTIDELDPGTRLTATVPAILTQPA